MPDSPARFKRAAANSEGTISSSIGKRLINAVYYDVRFLIGCTLRIIIQQFKRLALGLGMGTESPQILVFGKPIIKRHNFLSLLEANEGLSQ